VCNRISVALFYAKLQENRTWNCAGFDQRAARSLLSAYFSLARSFEELQSNYPMGSQFLKDCAVHLPICSGMRELVSSAIPFDRTIACARAIRILNCNTSATLRLD
jgi:hypothetical protein